MHNKQTNKQQRDGKKLIKHRSGDSYSSGQECKKFAQIKNHLKIRLPIRTTSRVRNTIKMAKWQEDTHTFTPAGFVLVAATRIYWERDTVQQQGQEKKRSRKKVTAAY
jgi:hypothetical protein